MDDELIKYLMRKYTQWGKDASSASESDANWKGRTAEEKLEDEELTDEESENE